MKKQCISYNMRKCSPELVLQRPSLFKKMVVHVWWSDIPMNWNKWEKICEMHLSYKLYIINNSPDLASMNISFSGIRTFKKNSNAITPTFHKFIDAHSSYNRIGQNKLRLKWKNCLDNVGAYFANIISLSF